MFGRGEVTSVIADHVRKSRSNERNSGCSEVPKIRNSIEKDGTLGDINHLIGCSQASLACITLFLTNTFKKSPRMCSFIRWNEVISLGIEVCVF